MPSVSKAQQRLMDAVDHGWKPTRMKGGGPSRKVAHDFVQADKAVGKRKLPTRKTPRAQPGVIEARAKPKAEY